jgi:hypothetical protein
MAFIDEVNTVREHSNQAREEMNALVKELSDNVYENMRKVGKLEWIEDDVLHIACDAFASTAIQQTVAPRQVLVDPGQVLTNG